MTNKFNEIINMQISENSFPIKKQTMKSFEKKMSDADRKDIIQAIKKLFKRLKLGVPSIHTYNLYDGDDVHWNIVSKKPVQFSNGDIGRIEILINEKKFGGWNLDIHNADRDKGKMTTVYGNRVHDFDRIEAVSEEDIKRQEMLEIVKKHFPKAVLHRWGIEFNN